VIEAPEFRRLELYREVFAPLGVHHQMAVMLPAPPRLLIGLAVVAPEDYTDAQRRMLDLRRFMRGETTGQAAASLSISPRTIHKHAESIYRKLGVTDRVAAVSTAWSALDAGR
jgi:DNA-binding NarL/FixJ family response regulator